METQIDSFFLGHQSLLNIGLYWFDENLIFGSKKRKVHPERAIQKENRRFGFYLSILNLEEKWTLILLLRWIGRLKE